ncbi:PucR family transcriptional regulator [Pseudonocardia hispaniensis]|uniref:PucR family transcriptional regulator n=1 Tax=Pseudonocardia hispaniensis TaxID=904933 RepID=A0ABW1J4Y0_9PSEU
MRELLGMPELRLRLVAGAAAVGREVTWAHASELVNPTEFLEGGELLLLTGVNLPQGETALGEYVARLAAAEVAAIGFGTGLGWDTVPPPLVESAERLGLPLLEVPRATPFLAITRAVARAITRRELAAKEYVLHAQHTLTAAAVGRGGVAAVLDEVVRLTDGWGLLLNRAGTVIASAPAVAAERTSALRADLVRLRDAPGAASVVTREGPAETWVQSLTAGTEVLGFLAVGRAGALTSAERQVVNAAVPLLTLSLNRSRMVSQGGRRLQASVLRLLFAGQTELVGSVAADLWNGLPAEPVSVLECAGTRYALAAARDRLARDRHVAAARALHGQIDEGLVCVVAADGDDEQVLLRALGGIEGLRIGVSEPAGYGDLDRARTEARRAAAHGAAEGSRTTRFRDVPRPGLLELLPATAAAQFSASLLRPLREDSAAERGDLLRSLRAWLSHHGQWDPAAAELGVHRHTLRNRVRKAEKLLGRRLDSPDLRAEIWLAMQLSEQSG